MHKKALSRLCGLAVAVIASPSAILMAADTSTQPTSLPSLPSATATIQVMGGATTTISPNERGAFPKVTLPMNGSTDVTVTYSGGAPSDQVVLVAEDGGSINGGVVLTTALNSAHAVNFNFKTTGNGGIYRILLRKGAEQNLLQFWEGKPRPFKHPFAH